MKSFEIRATSDEKRKHASEDVFVQNYSFKELREWLRDYHVLSENKDSYLYDAEVFFVCGVITYVKEYSTVKNWYEVVSAINKIITGTLILPLGEVESKTYMLTERFLDVTKLYIGPSDKNPIFRSALFEVKNFIRNFT